MDPKFTVLPDSGDYLVPSPDLSFMDVPFAPFNPDPATFTPSVSVCPNEVLGSTANGSSQGADSSFANDASESTDLVLKYISQILMEENVENTLWEDKDQLALRDTELSLYQVLGAQYSPVADQIVETPESILSGNSKENGSYSHSTLVDIRGDDCLMVEEDMFKDEDSVLQFKRGFKEGNKFLPKIDLKSINFASNLKEGITNARENMNEREQPPDGSRRRKNQNREERDSEEDRSTKQSTISMEEIELCEMFDKVLLCKADPAEAEAVNNKGGKTRSKRKENKVEAIDLEDFLILCAHAVSSSDIRTASELLKQIREHASPVGDGTERLAHYFANSLEARLKGVRVGIQNFGSPAVTKIPSADMLRAYDVILKALPYQLPICYACRSICKMAEKAKALHVVDFGILFGFQWPILIEVLSQRKGGPPKLRITGIDYPQQGFKPAERIEEAGRLLASYCERFNVPFEFKCLALQHWECLQIEDLELDSDQMLAVNNCFRFESLIDETTEVECPRDAVLRIIRSMNPDIFVHSVVNGCFTNPFFNLRFRKALIYYSTIFDAYDTTLSREEPARLMFEEWHGREVMNVVACEGSERIYRPESYKQWQIRNTKAGFQQVPLNQEVIHIVREKLKTECHRNFVIEEDGHWMLHRWKGRVVFAWSCWVPSSLEIPTNALDQQS